jgi:hypothetical protein
VRGERKGRRGWPGLNLGGMKGSWRLVEGGGYEETMGKPEGGGSGVKDGKRRGDHLT